MASSRLRPLTVKELEKRTSTRPHTIKHLGLGGVPGFVAVHTPADYVGFALVYRHGGKRKKLTLGSAKRLTLADARKMAAKYRSDVEAGQDPHGDKIAARLQEDQRERLDPAAMWEKYKSLFANQLRTLGEKDRIFRRYILPKVAKLEVSEITKTHALSMLDPLIAEGKLRMADVVRQEGAAWFAWLLEREHVERNPFAGLRKAQAGRIKRTRVLTDQELKHIWHATEPEGRLGCWMKLLILTGTRNMEARAARWSEIDLEARTWTIPPERSKNKTENVIYLTDAIVKLLSGIPRTDGVDLLFPAKGKPLNPMSGDQKMKDRVDARFRAAVEANGEKAPPQWQIHDFRRTIGTGLQRLGFRSEVADQVIGHVSSTRAGAAAHYLHYDFEKERRQALEAWSEHVLRVALSDE